MATPHPHAELIKKWADDTSIQIQREHHHVWLNDYTGSFNEQFEYRIKPEVIRYRVAFFKNEKNEKWTQTANDNDEEMKFKNSDNFNEWVTDWIGVEI